MQHENEKRIDDQAEDRGLSGLGQKIIGTIENLGGVLTGDPIAQAEGEFNAEVGAARGEIEESAVTRDEKAR